MHRMKEKVQPAPPPSCPRSTASAGREKRRNQEEPRQRQSKRWEKPRRGVTLKREGFRKLGKASGGCTSHIWAAVIMGALGNVGQRCRESKGSKCDWQETRKWGQG